MNPTEIPTDPQEEIPFAQWVMKESNRLAIKDQAMGGEIQGRMLRFWKEHRPMMWARLERLRITRQLAQVLHYKMEQAFQENLQAGMHRTDAQEQAEKDWYLMEEEAEENQDQLTMQAEEITS